MAGDYKQSWGGPARGQSMRTFGSLKNGGFQPRVLTPEEREQKRKLRSERSEEIEDKMIDLVRTSSNDFVVISAGAKLHEIYNGKPGENTTGRKDFSNGVNELDEQELVDEIDRLNGKLIEGEVEYTIDENNANDD